MTGTAPTTVHAARWDEVSSPFGLASLLHTHWLDGTPRTFEGAPGAWWAENGEVHGRDLPEHATVDLAPGTHIHEGRLRLRAFERDGALALRIYDPEAPGRLVIGGIESYPHDDAWAVPGRFVPASAGDELTIRSVDGYERTAPAGGAIELTLDGAPVRLTVTAEADGLNAVIADATAEQGAYRFRFLPIPAPDADGRVVVDFNAAHLPPCAFSDHYVCPLPPAENRLPVAVTAGEKRVLPAS